MKYAIQLNFLISILLLPIMLLSQSFSVPFHPHIPDTSFLYVSETNTPLYSNDSGRWLYLNDGTAIQQYSLFKKEIQSNSEGSVHNTVSILVGSTKQQLVVVVDKNFNHSFNDDSVYYIPLKLPGQTKLDYVKQLPIIKLNNLMYKDSNHIVHSFSARFRCMPVTASGEPFSDTSKLQHANFFKCAILSDFYYESIPFSYKGVNYQFNIFPYAITASVYPENRGSINGYAGILFYAIVAQQLHLISYNTLDYALATRRGTSFGNDSIHIRAIDFNSNTLHFTIDTALTTNRIPDEVLFGSRLYQLAEHKKEAINFQHKPYTILEFSGSWCKPCMALLPAIQQLQHQLPHYFQFITIVNEYSVEDAQAFYLQQRPTWPVYYEPMNCQPGNCLQNMLNVSIYPTFMVIDASGNILFNVNGINALEKLCHQFSIPFNISIQEDN